MESTEIGFRLIPCVWVCVTIDSIQNLTQMLTHTQTLWLVQTYQQRSRHCQCQILGCIVTNEGVHTHTVKLSKIGSRPILSIKVPVTIDTMLKFYRAEYQAEFKNIKEWRISLWWLVSHVSSSPTWAACEPHVSCMWGAPLHHWLNATCEGITVQVSHTWAVHEPHMNCAWGAPLHHWLNATCEGITVHVSHMWAVHEPHVSCTWGAPLHHWLNATSEGITMHVSHMWAAHEPHVSCIWATHELYMRGSPSTIDWMLHMRALPCVVRQRRGVLFRQLLALSRHMVGIYSKYTHNGQMMS